MTITAEQLAREREAALKAIRRQTALKDQARSDVNDFLNDRLPDPQEQRNTLENARKVYRLAYTAWRDLLISEHQRQLLPPLQIYRQAGITKQMFAKLRQSAAREQQQTASTTTNPGPRGAETMHPHPEFTS